MSDLIRLAFRSAGLTIAVLGLSLVAALATTGLLVIVDRTLAQPGAAPLRTFFLLLAITLVTTAAKDSLIGFIAVRRHYEFLLDFAKRATTVPLQEFERVGAHRLMVVLTDDCEALSAGMASIPPLLTHVFVAIAGLSYLGFISIKALGVMLSVLVLGVLAHFFGMSRVVTLSRQARAITDRIYEHLRAVTEGNKELRLHRPRRIGLFSGGLFPSTQVASKARRNVLALNATLNAWSNSLFFLAIAGVLFVPSEYTGLDGAGRTGYVMVTLYIAGPLQAIFSLLPVLFRATVALETIRDLGLDLQLVDDANNPQLAQPTELQALDFEQVCYEHQSEGSSFKVGPIDLSLRPGRILFIVGGNGSGKSTLAKILCGLYAPMAGEVRLNAEPIESEGERERMRQYFSVVFLEFFLNKELWGLSGKTDRQTVDNLIRKLGVSSKVSFNGSSFSTVDLSSGQRKRLALVTALLEDRPVYLFDEWAADQDPPFKETFYTEILPQLRAANKCVIVISHDDRYFYVADEIMRLEDGRVLSIQPGEGSRLYRTKRETL